MEAGGSKKPGCKDGRRLGWHAKYWSRHAEPSHGRLQAESEYEFSYKKLSSKTEEVAAILVLAAHALQPAAITPAWWAPWP